MRLNPSFKIHKIGSHYMIVDTDADNANLANVYSLNAVAGRLWLEAEDRDFSISGLADVLCDNYIVDRERAESDVRMLVEKWKLFGFLLPE